MYKFIHAADIHLDSPLRGLVRYEGAPVEEIRSASRQALQNLVQLAIDEKVSFIIFSGDVFDGDWKDFKTGLFFVEQMTRLRQADIRVFLVYGNHDAQSKFSLSLTMPANVQQFSSRIAETVHLEDLNTAIHGRSFPRRAVTEDWVPDYPAPLSGVFNIGILHTSLGGYSNHETYAPCSLDSLINKGYHYWALGHVHQEKILNQFPWLVFPGNIQGRHARETGPKGCRLVAVDNDEVQEVKFVELDVVRWNHLDIMVKQEDTEEEVLDKVRNRLKEESIKAAGRIMAVRLSVSGACAAHESFLQNPDKWRNEFRAMAIDISQEEIWLEKISFQTQSTVDLAANNLGAFSELLDFIQQKAKDDKTLTAWAGDLKKFREKLPQELISGEDKLSFEDPAWLKKLLQDGMQQAMGILLKGGENR